MTKTARGATARLYTRFIARLHKTGATEFCPTCYAYVVPGQHRHAGAEVVAVELERAA